MARVLWLLCVADLLVMLDAMVVTVALPAIGQDLGLARADLQWVVIAYTLSLGAFLLVGGRLGDALGRRRTLIIGLGLFAGASLGAGLARTLAPLLAARALQGVGAALAIPASLALLAVAFPSAPARQRALGRMSATLDAGMVAGLVLGGVVTATLGWPWCFFVVVASGVAAAALAPVALEESRDEDAPRQIDLLGAVLVASASGLLAYGIAREPACVAAALALVAASGWASFRWRCRRRRAGSRRRGCWRARARGAWRRSASWAPRRRSAGSPGTAATRPCCSRCSWSRASPSRRRSCR